MILLILYWLITTLMAIGVVKAQEEELSYMDTFLSMLLGWIVMPMKLGALLSHLHKD